MIIGDSITIGYYATGLNGYAQQFASTMQATYGSAGAGYVSPSHSSITYSGFSTVYTTMARTGTSGNTASITRTMASCALVYLDNDATADAEYQVDGGGYVSLSLDTSGSGTFKQATIPIGSTGSHTVNVRCSAGTLSFGGFITYTTDAASPSLAVSICGNDGYTGADRVTTRTDEERTGAIKMFAPDLVIVAYGVNDHGFETTLEAYRVGMSAHAAAARAAGAECVLMLPLRLAAGYSAPPADGKYRWTDRAETLKTVAAANNCVFLNTGARFGDWFNPDLAYTDRVHPNDAGHAFMLNELLAVVS